VCLLGEEGEQDTVDPVAVPPVRAAPNALADVADALCVRNRARVEAVDLELEAVVAEVVHQMLLEASRSVICDPAAAERRVHSEALEVRNPRTAVRELEAEPAGTLPIDLDHEPAVVVRLALRARHFLGDSVRVLGRDRAEERLYVLVGDQLDEEIDVVRARAADRDRHGVWAAGTRRGRRRSPDPSPMPSRISAIP